MSPLVIALIALIIGVSSAFLTKKDDGPIEQAMESVIEKETGMTVDLTPNSPEPK